MKKLLGIIALCAPLMLSAQKDDDDIVYYTDSDVSNSRIGLALNANPVYTDLRIINDDVGLGGGGFNLTEDEATGSFQLNYHLDLIYELSSSFDLSIGFGRANGGYRLENALFLRAIGDTIPVNDEVDVSMFTVPIKINFNSSISEVFDLEVVPTVELNFIDKYRARFIPTDPNEEEFTVNYTEETQKINYSVGIALGGTYWFADSWGVFLRANIKYMLNQMVDLPDFPRETLINYGVNTGIRYNF